MINFDFSLQDRVSRTQTVDLALIAQARKCARCSTRNTAKATRVGWAIPVSVFAFVIAESIGPFGLRFLLAKRVHHLCKYHIYLDLHYGRDCFVSFVPRTQIKKLRNPFQDR